MAFAAEAATKATVDAAAAAEATTTSRRPRSLPRGCVRLLLLLALTPGEEEYKEEKERISRREKRTEGFLLRIFVVRGEKERGDGVER